MLYATFCAGQCLIAEAPVRTIHLEVPADAEVRTELSVTANAFQVNVELSEWRVLYSKRQEGSRPIIVVGKNNIEYWLPNFGGVLHRSFIERSVFAGAPVQSFWAVGMVEKVSENEYRVTASKDKAVFIGFLALIALSGWFAYMTFLDYRSKWRHSWDDSLHFAT